MCCTPGTPPDRSVGWVSTGDRSTETFIFFMFLQLIDSHSVCLCVCFRDKPNVMYFDIIKCVTGTNIMAAALQGLQCPTTQVCLHLEFQKRS